MEVDAIDRLHLIVPSLEKAKAVFDREDFLGIKIKLVERIDS